MTAWDLVQREDGSFHPTRDEAIARAMGDLAPGDTITAHQGSCATARRQDCDCQPDVLVVPEPARA